MACVRCFGVFYFAIQPIKKNMVRISEASGSGLCVLSVDVGKS